MVVMIIKSNTLWKKPRIKKMQKRRFFYVQHTLHRVSSFPSSSSLGHVTHVVLLHVAVCNIVVSITAVKATSNSFYNIVSFTVAATLNIITYESNTVRTYVSMYVCTNHYYLHGFIEVLCLIMLFILMMIK